MRVILLEEVRNLGEPGTQIDVADGYARNYLLPRKLAVQASKGAVKSLEHHKRIAARRLESLAKDAGAVAERLSQVRVTLTAKAGEAGKMYGSVTAGQIADELERAHGIQVDKRKIHLEEPIKVLGEHVVQIRPRPEVRAELTVEVIAEVEEAEAEAAPAEEAQAEAETEAAQPEAATEEAQAEAPVEEPGAEAPPEEAQAAAPPQESAPEEDEGEREGGSASE